MLCHMHIFMNPDWRDKLGRDSSGVELDVSNKERVQPAHVVSPGCEVT
jgi:hypothetical protein